jgi:hypothetical protein
MPMLTWQPASRRQWYRLGAVAFGLALLGAGALTVATTTADAQTTLTVDSLDVAGTNQTVDGDVTDATLSTTLDYQVDVPDAERRTVRLKAGPSRGALELVDYQTESVTDGAASGSVTLDGSLTDHPQISAADINPAVAATETTEVVVQAEIEVQRENGETVTDTRTDTVTLSLTDGTELEAAIGGSGAVTIETDG